MAKRTLEQLEAKEKELMAELEKVQLGKKEAAKADADDAKTNLQEALGIFNKLAAVAGMKPLRLRADDDVVGDKSKGDKERAPTIKLDDEQHKSFTGLVAKAVKEGGKDGTNAKKIKEYLAKNDFVVDRTYREPHLSKVLAGMLESGEVVKTGKKSSTMYHIGSK